MSAREDARVTFGLAFAVAGVDVAMVDGVLDQYEAAHRAEVLREIADFVRDAHFRDGLSVQEIGTALRFMAADDTIPTSKDQQR